MMIRCPETNEAVMVDLENPGPDFAKMSPPGLLTCAANGLAGLQRYAGQTRPQLSVSTHCVLGALYLMREGLGHLDPEEVLAFLLHDVAEALGLGDICQPIKAYVDTDGKIAALERSLRDAFCAAIGVQISARAWEVASRVDRRIVLDEFHHLQLTTPTPWNNFRDVTPLGISSYTWRVMTQRPDASYWAGLVSTMQMLRAMGTRVPSVATCGYLRGYEESVAPASGAFAHMCQHLTHGVDYEPSDITRLPFDRHAPPPRGTP